MIQNMIGGCLINLTQKQMCDASDVLDVDDVNLQSVAKSPSLINNSA